MGFDLNRILDVVDEELKCRICHNLLENPVLLSECQHIFCGKCLNEWLAKHMICPIDGMFVTHLQIKSAPKLFQNFITKYEISCDFFDYGCKTLVKVDHLMQHITTCEFNPQKDIRLETGVEKNVGNYLNAKIERQLKEIESLEMRVENLENESSVLRQDLDKLKKVFGWDTRTLKFPSKGKLLVKINDKIIVIDANPKEMIQEIKNRVQQIENINAEELLVFFANQELDSDKTLSDYRINKLSNPLFLLMVRKKMRIIVRIDREREYSIEVSPKDTVGDILPMVLRKEALTSNELMLSYRNQILDVSRTLFSYKIRDGNFVFLNTRKQN